MFGEENWTPTLLRFWVRGRCFGTPWPAQDGDSVPAWKMQTTSNLLRTLVRILFEIERPGLGYSMLCIRGTALSKRGGWWRLLLGGRMGWWLPDLRREAGAYIQIKTFDVAIVLARVLIRGTVVSGTASCWKTVSSIRPRVQRQLDFTEWWWDTTGDRITGSVHMLKQ
jgi:hypothetical protein